MPTPLPDYVPGPIVDYIAFHKLNGLKGLARLADIPHTTLCFMLRDSKHEALTAFLDFCLKVNQDPNDVADVLKLPERARTQKIHALLLQSPSAKDEGAPPSFEAFYRNEEVCGRYVQQLCTGESGHKVHDLYIPVARLLGMKLIDLAGMLG